MNSKEITEGIIKKIRIISQMIGPMSDSAHCDKVIPTRTALENIIDEVILLDQEIERLQKENEQLKQER